MEDFNADTRAVSIAFGSEGSTSPESPLWAWDFAMGTMEDDAGRMAEELRENNFFSLPAPACKDWAAVADSTDGDGDGAAIGIALE